MQVWPFPPRQDLVEALSWATNIIRAKSAEQRIAMRSAPRRDFNLQHTLTDTEYSAARAMVRGNDVFQVPDWPQALDIGAIGAGTAVEVDHPDLAYIDFFDGAALLWESIDRYEVITVEQVGSVYSITSIQGAYNSAYLIPLLQAYLPAGLSVQRRPAPLHDVSASFEIFQNNDLGASALAQYRGHDVLTDCPVVGSGAFTESMAWEYSAFDNTSGIPEYLRRRTLPDLVFQMRWHVFTKANLWLLRRWIHSRRGRQKAFWLSSLAQDLLPAASIGSASTTILVFKLPGIADLGRDTAFDIEIATSSGARYYRQVTSATPGATVGGAATISLTISSALGTSVSLAQIERISFLRCSRFNSDQLEFNHRASAGTAVQVPCIEVPFPS